MNGQRTVHGEKGSRRACFCSLKSISMALLAISGNEVQLRLSYGGRTRINESRGFGFHGDMLYPGNEIAGGSMLTRMN